MRSRWWFFVLWKDCSHYITTNLTTQNVENYFFIFLDDIRLDRVKSRRGRSMRTKKPFWNFSRKTSVANKRERRQSKLKNASKKLKIWRKQINRAKLVFDQNKIRTHLISCLTQLQCSNFPSNIDTNWKKRKNRPSWKKIYFAFAGGGGAVWQRNYPVYAVFWMVSFPMLRKADNKVPQETRLSVQVQSM